MQVWNTANETERLQSSWNQETFFYFTFYTRPKALDRRPQIQWKQVTDKVVRQGYEGSFEALRWIL